MSRKDRIWSRRQIEGLIASGRQVVILDGQVLQADAWLPFHPGGDKAILHMVGRDSTDEIHALHSPEAQRRMQKFVIGRVEGRWRNFVPPIQGGIFRTYTEEEAGDESVDGSGEESDSSGTEPDSPLFDPVDPDSSGLRRRQTDTSSMSSASSISLSLRPDTKIDPMDARTQEEISSDLLKYPSLDATTQDGIVQKYRALNERIIAEGLYNCNYTAYAIECFRYTLLFGLFFLLLRLEQFALSGLSLGLFWHQLVFTAHDAGHMGITHDFQIDSCLAIVISDFLGGLSSGWWKRNHNVHHIVTNSPEHDPDIEHLPFFAISHRLFGDLYSSYYDRVMPFDAVAQWAVQYQHYLYYPILLLGRFNLYVLSWLYLLSPTQAPRHGPAKYHRHLELLGQLFFWTWFGYFTLYRSIPTLSSRMIFLLVSHMVTAPLHVQITLSHFAMSTSDLGPNESFPQKMLRTTMDVDCPAWLDWVHGGLQFQAVHHLFPRVPRHNLRKTQKLVLEFCNEVNIPYAIYGFVDGNKEVISRLEEVGKQVRIFEECRRVATRDLIEGEKH